jgi:glucokinase
MTLVLVADIGGTHIRFALADASGIYGEVVLKGADFKGPAEAAQAYLAKQSRKPDVGAFAIAGPIVDPDSFKLTNIEWMFTRNQTASALHLSDLFVINDFHALALGILQADKKHLHQIGGGLARPHGNIGVIGPGTGLGVASLVWDAKTRRHIAIPCEGGHVTAPAEAV